MLNMHRVCTRRCIAFVYYNVRTQGCMLWIAVRHSSAQARLMCNDWLQARAESA
jgi:hypothetical protein